jgi:Tfp pilus assembly protein PilX
MKRYKNRKAAVLLICMIFLCVFATLALSMATVSGINAQISSNFHKSNGARACAESGLEITRCWIGEVSIPGTTSAGQKFTKLGDSLKSKALGISEVTVISDSNAITIPTITLDSASGKNFSAVITPLDSETLRIEIIGACGSLSKNIRANYKFGKRGSNVFDFGVASKGPVSLQGNIELAGVNIAVESNVYIESEFSNLALSIIGNSQIAGDVSIVNPSAYVDLQGGHAEIGGESGQDAIDHHVRIGVPSTEFPTPDPEFFRNLVTLTNLPANYGSQSTFENVIIPPNTNPSFSSNVTFKGVLFVEVPNQVTFNGNVNITGIVVGNGDPTDNSKTNTFSFSGNVSSSPITNLPADAKFDPLRDQAGTFLMSPGFAVSFGGNFHTLNGAVAANGVDFYGNAGGTINGSVINYSPDPMTFQGNSDLYFNRSNASTNPPGFVPEIVLKYDPTSYAEGPF